MDNPDFWKRKLLAFLHDPPEKAYDYGPNHISRAVSYQGSVLRDQLTGGIPADWNSSAADRFIFPAGGTRGLPQGMGHKRAYIHPLSGSKIFCSEDFPEEDDAIHWISSVLPNYPGTKLSLKERHFLIWRLWREFVATHAKGAFKNHKGPDRLAYLPADTRIPDHTIWHHLAVTSAFEGGFTGGNPQLFLFQVGPVQEFIAQARSTRDLWSGSYLLSWLAAHAIVSVTDEYGPDCMIFPSLCGQPLFDWLHQDLLSKAYYKSGSKESLSYWKSHRLNRNRALVLTPNLPNRFLAIVSKGFEASTVVDSTKGEYRRIAEAVWNWLENESLSLGKKSRALWDKQVETFLEISWQLWPLDEAESCVREFEEIPSSSNRSVNSSMRVATAIPDYQLDVRCYEKNDDGTLKLSNGKPRIVRPGWAWHAQYQLATYHHDARRQTRNFKAWQGRRNSAKDSLSGKEEAIIRQEWLERAREHSTLKHLFRKSDLLGAPNLIKRLWHRVYLQEHVKPHFQRGDFRFFSVPSIAASKWKDEVAQRLKDDRGATETLLDLEKVLRDAGDLIEESLRVPAHNVWFEKAEPCLFQETFWEGLEVDTHQEPLRRNVVNALRAFIDQGKFSAPPKYYAVLAIDGDQIGKWLAGEKTPTVKSLLTENASKYFSEINDGVGEEWLAGNRPLSPSYHLQFSEALANFGLFAVRRVVEAHGGQLVYAGGDDVLALLPAQEALSCTEGLRMAFQGAPDLAKMDAYSEIFAEPPSEGMLLLKKPEESEPTWPLLVPGPNATISAGIAVGHIKAPLQDLVRAAQQVLHRAKSSPVQEMFDRKRGSFVQRADSGLGRNAVAMTLLKRSGERIEWGYQFGSVASELLQLFQTYYRNGGANRDESTKISRRFPYWLYELLQPYRLDTPLSNELGEIVLAEFASLLDDRGQARGLTRDQRTELMELAKAYIRELINFRVGEFTTPRPIGVFANLFVQEAFMSRQGE